MWTGADVFLMMAVALDRIAERYGKRTAAFVALQLEYARPTARRRSAAPRS